MAGPYVGELGAVGLAKELTPNTWLAPTRFIPVHLPLNIGSPDINLLLAQGIQAIPDEYKKAQQGAGQLKDGKMKFDVEPENCGEVLMAAFGTDTLTEQSAIVISAGVNDAIDFKESGGAQLHCTIAAGTYAMGTSSAVNLSLCKAVKTAMDAAAGAIHTYTITFVLATGKLTVTPSAGTIQILWLTGTNQATAAYTALGFSHTDTSNSATVTSDSTATIAMQHAFTRLNSAVLPTYSLWVSNGQNYPEFAGCMLNKLDLEVDAGGFVTMEADWEGQKFVSGGATQTTSYSGLYPFKFDQAVLTVAGAPVTLYKKVKLTIDNKVKVTPVIGGSIYSNVVYSEGLMVSLSATIVVQDATEWTKFVNGTSSSFVIALTGIQNIVGVKKHSLTFTIPTIYYKAAPLPLGNGLIEITFQAVGVYTPGSTETIDAALVNSIGATY